LACVLLRAAVAASFDAGEFTGNVVSIADSDTIRVMSHGVPVQLWGADCPEAKQPFGTRAKQFTAELAFSETVAVRVHDIDRCKRTVAEIILPDGRNPKPRIRPSRVRLVVSAMR
jgi:micrococcal nuclease